MAILYATYTTTAECFLCFCVACFTAGDVQVFYFSSMLVYSVWPHDGCNLFVSGHHTWIIFLKNIPNDMRCYSGTIFDVQPYVRLITVQNHHCWLLQNLLQIIIFLAKKSVLKCSWPFPPLTMTKENGNTKVCVGRTRVYQDLKITKSAQSLRVVTSAVSYSQFLVPVFQGESTVLFTRILVCKV